MCRILPIMGSVDEAGDMDVESDSELELMHSRLEERGLFSDPVHNFPPPGRYKHFPKVANLTSLAQERLGELLGPCYRSRVNVATGFFDYARKDIDYTKTRSFACTSEFEGTEFTAKFFKTNPQISEADIQSNVVVTGNVHAHSVHASFFSKFLQKDWHFFSKKIHLVGASLTKADLTGILAYGSMYKVDLVGCVLVGPEKLSIVELFFLLRFTDFLAIDIKGLDYPKNWLESVNKIQRINRIKLLKMRHIKINFQSQHMAAFLKKHVDPSATIELTPQAEAFSRYKSKGFIMHLTRWCDKKFLYVSAVDFEKAEGNQKVLFFSPKPTSKFLRYVEATAAAKLHLKRKGKVEEVKKELYEEVEAMELDA
uniref:FBD domain-containing protein n=1 Tax=Panagrellus redivivus TaxID=6233 RepID=A0A7E4ZXZ6_PANRE